MSYTPRNHPQQTSARGPIEDVDDRGTDQAFFDALSQRFGGFSVDVAASIDNRKCPEYFDRATNGLAQPWEGHRVWCNPPYSDIAPWVRKAWVESAGCPVIVMLLPSNRTEQGWWQELVEPYRDRSGSPLAVEFLPGRLRFLRPGQVRIGPDERPPFGCCLLIWRRPEIQFALQGNLATGASEGLS